MIWSEFQKAVKVLLTVDAKRKGVGIQGYIDSVILSGAIEVQQYIPSLRAMNRSTFRREDLVRSGVEGFTTQAGRIDTKGKITTATVMKPTSAGGVVSIELNRWPWSKANSLGMGCLSDCRSPRYPGKIMMRPGTRTFFVYPEVDELELLVLDWEGVKTSYQDTDDTPFDQRVVKVVSDYAKAHVVREVDKDLKLYGEYYATYVKERASLYLDEKDMTLFDLPSITQDHYSRCCIENPEIEPEQAVAPLMPSRFDFITSPQPANFGGTYIYVDPVTGSREMPVPPAAVYGLTYSLLPNAPTALSIPNARLSEYLEDGMFQVYTISESDVQIPPPPSDFELFAPPARPTLFGAVEGVPAPPSSLEAITKPLPPKILGHSVLYPPARPTSFIFVGFPPEAPTQLQYPARRPTRFHAGQEADWPAQPTDFDYMVAPSNLEAALSNASGTVIVPDAPEQFRLVHDGVGGSWVPNAPLWPRPGIQIAGEAPLQPTLFQVAMTQYAVYLYKYNASTKSYTQIDVTSINNVGESPTGASHDLLLDSKTYGLIEPISLASGRTTDWTITAPVVEGDKYVPNYRKVEETGGAVGTYWDAGQEDDEDGLVFVVSEGATPAWPTPGANKPISAKPVALNHRLKGLVTAPSIPEGRTEPILLDLYMGSASMVLGEDRYYYWVRAHVPEQVGPQHAGKLLTKYRLIKKRPSASALVSGWTDFSESGIAEIRTIKATDFTDPAHPGTEVNNYLSNGLIFGSSATADWTGVEYIRIPKARIEKAIIRPEIDAEFATLNSAEDASFLELSWDESARITIPGKMHNGSSRLSVDNWMDEDFENTLWVELGPSSIAISNSMPGILASRTGLQKLAQVQSLASTTSLPAGAITQILRQYRSTGLGGPSVKGAYLQKIEVKFKDGSKKDVTQWRSTSVTGITYSEPRQMWMFDLAALDTLQIAEINPWYYIIMA